jgi:hypothetical protein
MAATESPGAEPGASQVAAEAVSDAGAGAGPLGESPASVANDADAFDERPEAFVGAAFIGGFALALILKRAAR